MPRPAEFYFDSDPHATKPVVAIRETGDAAMQKLLATIKRDPHANAEAAQLAHMAMQAGRVEVGQALYGRALGNLSSSSTLWRSVIWNYGWDLYRAGDHAGAFAQWHTLLTARNLTATWMPPTFALALWSVDRKDEAVEWYAAAVRSEPDQWRGTSRYAELLPDWTAAERATLAEVQAAWDMHSPSWP
jgi:tetratricopeptide (TPR) repeat protein